ncbi:alpha/beta hydrolase [Companilactobacillus sp.]|uniref:alpha/beta hydrolase n=1 Tax=Companilactobacillus sp. TaxID=2767905 RepID=UPI0025BC61E3|nr:alpha/beta hydrolase [Companilactobacillus sp.]MCH4009693.1 alpha/beta hydrolase [Companilactobacillus sp.]MCH4052631.1 alpha/beta hydrolase [Companilactobacillus sp.]MCH4077635.1 alpha/beta hydrolase [Companilactobacillus sp.]MCH4126211.1 alpha/beta hydrolase [Companilactobacillus sp.]MCI1311919.1 alpha/beta hydrolase [Companilactobacillus sp.]
MKRIKNKRSLVTIISIILVVFAGLAIPSYIWAKDNVKYLRTVYTSKMSPIIMIPGSSASQYRFDKLVTQLNKKYGYQHSLLRLKVYNDGKISYSGTMRSQDTEPIIVVGFENNHDGYDNIKKQAKMFSDALTVLQDKYHFNNFKAIGHSNGGLIYTAFIEQYLSKHDIKMKKLMTIGSPYNFSEDSTTNKTEMLADFIKNREKIPKSLTVYSIAGTENYTSDGLVPESSVRAGKYIYQNQVKHFTEMTVTGDDAQHSDLPQNSEIIRVIQDYIVQNHVRPNNNNRTRRQPKADQDE